jgi:phenylacetate-coenzyme A ligase PaaK-like adenylate-forming protein
MSWDSMSFEEQKSLQDKKIKNFIQEVYKYHPHYHKLMNENGIKPSDVTSTDSFIKKFPFTSKMDIAPTDEHPFKPDHFIMQNTLDLSYTPRFYDCDYRTNCILYTILVYSK